MALISIIKLLLPSLFPSWRFFMTVGPSPRVEYRRIRGNGTTDWAEVAPRPATISVATMAKRFLWNADWNEQLFLVSCAERLIQNPTQHSIDELTQRVARRLGPSDDACQLRLIFVSREGEDIQRTVCWEGAPFDL